MKGNVIQMNTLHLNSVRLNGIGKVQSVSLKGGSTEDPVFPPVEPPVEPEPTPTYTLSASVANGVVSATLNGVVVSLPYTANEGDTIVVSVTPNDGYAFEGWNDGNTDNPRTITMTADVALSAQCVEVVAPSKYIQFEDAEVERVLMSKGVSSDGVGITKEDAANVTSIGTWFKSNTTIQTFDELRYFTRVTSLSYDAFVRATIKSIDISNVSNIGGNAFLYSNLEGDFILPKLTAIEGAAFRGTKIKSFVAENLISIPNASGNGGVFHDCKSLTDVSIPSATFIGKDAFVNATSLTSVEMQNVETIGKYAFKNTGLTGDLILPKLNAVGSAAFRETKITSFVAKNLVSIEGNDGGGGAFFNCPILAYVELEAITSIGSDAFAGCSSLKDVIIRAITPPTLGAYAFNNSKNATIYVPDASLEAYKTATNWNTYADRIHPLSEIEGSLVFYDKLVGDGTAYINTELMPNSFDNYEWKADPPRYFNKFIFGAKSNNQSALALVYNEAQSYYIYVGHNLDTKKVSQENSDFMHRMLRFYQRQSDGMLVRELYDFIAGNSIILGEGGGNAMEYIGTLPLLLFACNKSATDAAAERIYGGAIYSFIVTDSRTNEVRISLKPCTWNGEAGMWDEVGNKFYGNAATSGEFSVAND